MPQVDVPDVADTPDLSISLRKVAFIITKAREYDVKVADSDPDSGSNPADDGQSDVLEDKAGDLTGQELFDAIRGLPEDERMELIELAWIGRGTYTLADWKEAIDMAYAEHASRPANYLMALPLLGDYLEEGIAAFGESIVDDTDEEDDNANQSV